MDGGGGGRGGGRGGRAVCKVEGDDLPCDCVCAFFRTFHTLTAGGGLCKAVWASTIDKAAEVISLFVGRGSPFMALTAGMDSAASGRGNEVAVSRSFWGADNVDVTETDARVECGAELLEVLLGTAVLALAVL